MVRLDRWGAGLIVAMSLGCGALAPEPRVCTAQFVYGLQVTVLDSVTRAPAGRTALVVAREGDYADTAHVLLPVGSQDEVESVSLVGERAGVYDVTVKRDGYQSWQQSGVEITADECHVRLTRLTALLQRVP